jgi:PAS domain S-box-containing protein
MIYNETNADQGPEQLIPGIAQECFWDWDLLDDRVYMSRHYCEQAGHIRSEVAFASSYLKTIIHPDDQQKFFHAVSALSRGQEEAASIEYRMVTGNGSIRWISYRLVSIEHDENGRVSRIVGSVFDVTERKEMEERLSRMDRSLLTISNCSQALLHATSETGLLNDICRIVVELGGYRMAWVGYAQDDEEKSVRPVAQAGFEEGYLETLRLSWADVDRGRGPAGMAIRSGRIYAIRSMQTDPGFTPWRTEALKRGYSSALSLPLKKGDRVFGALTIYSSVHDAFDAEETTLLSSLADNLAYGVSMQQDRKARESAEDALRQSEARYRTLFQNRHTVMLIIDPEDGSIVDANPAAVSFYGWERDELCRMKISQISLLPAEDVETEMQFAPHKQVNTNLFRHRLADETVRDVEVFSGPITIQGKLLLYSIVNDITERKRSQEQLFEGNKRMHYIMAATNAGLWEVEFGTNTAIWSDEIWRLYGLEPHSCVPSHENWLKSIVQEDRARVERVASEAKENGAEFSAMWRVWDVDGKERWLMSKGTPYRDSDGNVSRYVGIVIDITDRKVEEVNKEHLESRLRNSQRLETIGTLAGGIAHDFNNILMPILGYAEMGVIGDPSEDALNEYFTEIMRAAERAKNLISQIMTFSRAQEVTRSVMSVQAVVAEALKLLRPSIPTSIRIEQHIDQSCSNILADPSQIHQVIVNLCTNAFHALERSGEGVIKIELSEVVADRSLIRMFPKMRAGRYVLLKISDTGCGMDEETVERIFEPFYTTKPVNKGSGLGLSMVHGIIIGHRGEIAVESSPGKGTSFHVYLPVVDEQITSQPLDPAPSPGNCSVLFVDDEPGSLKMMTLMMNKLGFRIRALDSPLEALELFRQDPSQYDLVITDLTMPEMQGVDFAEELHKINPRLPIILMTGYGKDIDYIKPVQHYGISRILKKPVKMSRLSSTINELLSGDP